MAKDEHDDDMWLASLDRAVMLYDGMPPDPDAVIRAARAFYETMRNPATRTA